MAGTKVWVCDAPMRLADSPLELRLPTQGWVLEAFRGFWNRMPQHGLVHSNGGVQNWEWSS